MPVKRPVDDDAGPPMPPKHSRQDLHIEYDPNASLAATARRKGASNRTGQACDRCKVRSQKNLGGKRKMESQKERERAGGGGYKNSAANRVARRVGGKMWREWDVSSGTVPASRSEKAKGQNNK